MLPCRDCGGHLDLSLIHISEPTRLLGIAVSVLKYLLVLSVLFSAFDALNEDYCLVGPRTIERSKSYKPVRWLSESIFPFLEWVGERVPRQEEKTETDG